MHPQSRAHLAQSKDDVQAYLPCS